VKRDWLEAMASDFPLHAAVAADDISAVPGLLNTGVGRVHSLDNEAWTPLMWAKSPEVARALLVSGADPFYADPWGQSVLMAVSRRANAATVTVLIEAGVDPNSADGIGNVALGEAASSGNIDTVQELLRHGANPDVQTLSGESPIWAAIRENHLDVLDALLRSGARTDQRWTLRPVSGRSPLNWQRNWGTRRPRRC
jgi:uncharacterized protein